MSDVKTTVDTYLAMWNEADPILSSIDADDRATLIAEQEDGGYRFDVRLQGDDQTVFFAVV